MPLYEYECLKTGKRFEIIQKFSDPILTECPDEDCDGQVKKLLSAPAIQFKGEGWYVNDYGKGGQKPKKDDDGASAKSSSDSKSESKSTTKSESKSTEKAAAKSD